MIDYNHREGHNKAHHDGKDTRYRFSIMAFEDSTQGKLINIHNHGVAF